MPELEQVASWHQQGRLAEAEAGYRRLLEAEPDRIDALTLMGALLMQSGQEHEGEVRLRQAVELAPDYVPALLNLGQALRVLDQFEEAVTVLRKAVELDPDDVKLTLALAGALAAHGELAAAEPYFQQAVLHDPGNVEALRGLALLARMQGQLGDAVLYLQRCLAMGGDKPGIAAFRRTVLAEMAGRLVPDCGPMEIVAYWRGVLSECVKGKAVLEYGLGELAQLADSLGAARAYVVAPASSLTAEISVRLAESVNVVSHAALLRDPLAALGGERVDFILLAGSGLDWLFDPALAQLGAVVDRVLAPGGVVLPASVALTAQLVGTAGLAGRLAYDKGLIASQIFVGPEVAASLDLLGIPSEIRRIDLTNRFRDGIEIRVELPVDGGQAVAGVMLRAEGIMPEPGGLLLPFPSIIDAPNSGMLSLRIGRDFSHMWAIAD